VSGRRAGSDRWLDMIDFMAAIQKICRPIKKVPIPLTANSGPIMPQNFEGCASRNIVSRV
jgi:hypothetical protein